MLHARECSLVSLTENKRPKQATLQGYKVVFTLKYSSLLTKFVQCERSECELPETGLMRFAAMRISVNEPYIDASFCTKGFETVVGMNFSKLNFKVASVYILL